MFSSHDGGVDHSLEFLAHLQWFAFTPSRNHINASSSPRKGAVLVEPNIVDGTEYMVCVAWVYD